MEYRREIDGLRAFAVLPVILFHAGFEVFGGGFVGVDVFFVISGYLITTIILSDLRDDKFSLGNFYERRARRILPALFFVMLCCFPFAWFYLPPNHLEGFSKSLAAVPLFSSNFLFLKESGYFDTAAELKPLLHTWSLAVEEQFYVLFPLFLMAFSRFRKLWVLVSLILITVVSLIGAEYGSHSFPSAAFFLLPTRAWELAIGAIVAFFLIQKRICTYVSLDTKVGEVLASFGFGLILYSVLVFDKNTPLPGFYSLIPTVGTALIIIFASQGTVLGRFLGLKPIVSIGLVSYSAYLWHQPIYVFARHASPTELSLELLTALSVLSFLLAYFSWYFIEAPFRSNSFSRKKVFSFAVVGSVFYVVVGLTGYLQEGVPERFDFSEALTSSFERPKPEGDCFEKDKLHEVDDWYCEIGKNGSKPSFIAFGDSHLLSLYDTFKSASGDLGESGIFVGAGGCAPFLGIHSLRSDQNTRNCYELNKRVLHYAVEHSINNVFLVARWTYYTDGGYSGDHYSYLGLNANTAKSKENSRIAFLFGFDKTVEEYKKNGISLHLFSQVPEQEIEPADAYYRASIFEGAFRNEALQRVSVSLEKHKKLNKYVSGVFERSRYPKIINYDDLLCEQGICPIGTNTLSYYFDDDHLSIQGAKRLTPSIRHLLSQSLK